MIRQTNGAQHDQGAQHRLQQLFAVLVTTKDFNKSGNLPFAQLLLETNKNIGFMHGRRDSRGRSERSL